MAGRVALIILLIACVVAGCGGSTSSLSTISGEGNSGVELSGAPSISGAPAPSMNELQGILQAEFDRLGIDPDKVSAAAPTGETNAVFDLAAEVIDPDGEGPLDPTGIELAWTERLLGDYSQDGMVTANDLSPIGQNYSFDTSEPQIEYDDSSLHSGLAYWPSGAPDGDGAQNWYLARIDGNSDGQILMHDITPIAQHWQEKLSGYRIYRKGPGESEFVRLPNPVVTSSAMTITRPSTVTTDAPVRYSFQDAPPGQGEYEYYVIGWSELTGHSSSEAETQSNHVKASMDVSLTDTTPPVWDTTVGIVSATDNADGTVTIEWGTATDIAVPPALASPPVSYTVYYSTESPIDFTDAAKVEGLDTTIWSSWKLVADQEYFFAVRAQDSANPPNEDTNTAELGLAVTDPEPVEDTDPPVWTEQYSVGTYNNYTGIRSVRAGDGELYITCADAVDELSPPVHYDLYYLSARKFSTIEGEDGLIRPEAQVIEDIPKEYTLQWENRHEVLLTVYARDSASPPNVEDAWRQVRIAPTDLKKVILDPFVPGLTEDSTSSRIVTTQDIERRTLYSVYAEGPDKSSRIVYFLELDIESGNWEAEQLLDDPNSTYGYGSYVLTLAPSGKLWLRVKVYTGAFGVGYYRYYFREFGGSWIETELPDPPDGFWNGILDRSEFPIWVSYGGTAEEGEYPLKLHFYDSEAEEWREEIACDYAANPLAFWRPDGVLQLVTTKSGTTADDIPRYVVERSPEGVWTEVLSGNGKTVALPVTTPQWGAQLAWAVLTDMRGELELLAYGQEGYQFLPADGFDPSMSQQHFHSHDDDPFINQAWGAGDSYHALPYWLYDSGQYTEYSYRAADVLGNWYEPIHTWLNEARAYRKFGGTNDTNEEIGQLIWLDPHSGHCAFIGVEHNLDTKRKQVYMLTTFGKGASVYDPLSSGWV